MIRFGPPAVRPIRLEVGVVRWLAMVTGGNEPILDGVVTPDGTIVIDRSQVTALGVSPGTHVALMPVPGRIRSYLGAGDHLGPVPAEGDFRQLRDELWKGFGQEMTP